MTSGSDNDWNMVLLNWLLVLFIKLETTMLFFIPVGFF